MGGNDVIHLVHICLLQQGTSTRCTCASSAYDLQHLEWYGFGWDILESMHAPGSLPLKLHGA